MPRGIWRGLGLLLLNWAVLAIYLPAARGPFIFDDTSTIVNNESIRQLWPLMGEGQEPGLLNPLENMAVSGLPLVNFSFALNYHFGKLNPFGYRVANFALHTLTAFLLWAVVARTLQLDYFANQFERSAEPLAFATALVWALNPLVTESVVYVMQRTELMMGMFCFSTLYYALRYWSATLPKARIAWLILASAACVTGMLCKEMIASAPAVVLIYERTFHAHSFQHALRQSWRMYAGLSLTWLVTIALNYGGSRTPEAGFGLGVSVIDSLRRPKFCFCISN